MARLLAERRIERVNGVALDLGVSSMQLDQAERGFSFASDGPLSMSMEQAGPSAADAVNGLPEAELARIIARYGEERRARQVARAIVQARREAPITRTAELAAIVCRVVKPGKDGLHPATRTFQALRIHVNDELGELERGLRAAEKILAPDGRLAVVAFHSLEDARVKAFLRERSGALPGPSRHEPAAAGRGPAPTFELLFRKALKPGAAECAANPRARSARLRAARRTAAPAWPDPASPNRDRTGAAA
jgi:16S rRNA (cytosine1402-N4)-methyltransferase